VTRRMVAFHVIGRLLLWCVSWLVLVSLAAFEVGPVVSWPARLTIGLLAAIQWMRLVDRLCDWLHVLPVNNGQGEEWSR
jgi:hypothetical protein